MAQSFRDLEVWQNSMQVALIVDRLTDDFARPGNWLRWQLQKSSTSIPFNIAEGYRRRSKQSYINHVSIAMGSQGELDNELEFAVRSGRLTQRQIAEVTELNARVGWQLFRLWESLGGRNA